jgi:dynein heavy chain
MQSVIKTLREKHNYQTFDFAFSSHTQSSETQFSIEDKLERRRRNLLGGHYNKKVVIYIDDINMPSYDLYGT